MWVIFLIIGLIVLLAIVFLIIWLQYLREYWRFLELPHERPNKLVDIVKSMRGYGPCYQIDEVERYRQIYQQFKGTGPFCGFYHLLQPRVLVLDHELAKQILIKDFSNFNDRGIYYNTRSDPLSGNLYSIRGNAWKDMRLKLEPIFAKEQMHYIYNCIANESHKLLQVFDAAIKQQVDTKQSCFEIQPLVYQYVLATIGACVFGLDAVQQQKYPFEEFAAMTELALNTSRHSKYICDLLARYPLVGRRLGCEITPKKVHNYFFMLIQDVIGQREEHSEASRPQDFLQLLVDIKTQEFSTRETEEVSDSKQLKDHLTNELAAHAFVFLKAGLMPTASMLAYVLYELAVNQELQQRVRKEIRDSLARHENILSYECVQELKFMGQVISETIRTHPVKPYLIRRTLNEYRVPGHSNYLIRKDMYVIIPAQAMHNDPNYYPEPHLFRPERFTAENNRTRESCTWLGFGDGPRNCIGKHFAQLQMRVALARLLIRYNFQLDLKRLVIRCDDSVALNVERLSSQSPEESDEFGKESETVI